MGNTGGTTTTTTTTTTTKNNSNSQGLLFDIISLDWLLGRPETIDEKLKAMRDKLKETRNGIDEQIDDLKSEKRSCEWQIKVQSQKDKPDREEMKTQALRFVKYKNQIARMQTLTNKILQFDGMLSEVRVNHQISEAFVGLARCIDKINVAMNPAQLFAIIEQYEKSMMKMETNQDMIEEQIADATGDPADDEADAEEIMEQVFAELDIEIQAELPEAPKTAPKAKVKGKSTTAKRNEKDPVIDTSHLDLSDDDRELFQRLNDLNK